MAQHADDLAGGRLGRRLFLQLTAGGASAVALAACGQAIAAIAPATAEAAAPAAESRFGRMFPALPAADFAEEALLRLADAMIAPPETDDAGQLRATPESEADDEENYGLPAGYTYFGQFVDHDITLDLSSSLAAVSDPRSLSNFRSPALDLDSLYGGGPAQQPYMYAPGGRSFMLGDRSLTGALRDGGPVRPLVRDLPRFHGRAIIGDKRNDENVIVSQLHGMFMRFHNFLAGAYPERPFAEIQRLVRWHYQWLVLLDYLPRIIGRDQVLALLPHLSSGRGLAADPPRLRFFRWQGAPAMPVEFSGAAYRFGHSLVRPVYRLSAADLPSSTAVQGLGGRRALFAASPADGLNGFQEFDAANGIDWRLFFEARGRVVSPTSLGKGRVQPAYKIDSSLTTALGFLPEFSKPGTNAPAGTPNTNSLSYRNLKRGVALGLPTGQAVARAMGLAPLADERLLVGKANMDGLRRNPSIASLDARFAGRAPLWFYILAEAQDGWRRAAEAQAGDDAGNAQPTMLGPLGGRIVGEVLIGLLLADPDSFLNAGPGWQPMFGDAAATSPFARFTMGDLIEAVPMS